MGSKVTINWETDCLARLTWEGMSCITRIYLADYKFIIDNLPKGTCIKVLCYKGNDYKWIELESVSYPYDKSRYNIFKEKTFGLEVIANKGYNIEVAVLPKGIFNVNKMTFSSLVLALATDGWYGRYRIKWSSDGIKENCYTVKTFLSNFKKVRNFNPRFVNLLGVELDLQKLVEDINEVVDNMLDENELFISYLYLYNILSTNWALAPLIFCNTFSAILENEFVPYCLNPLLYLKYGYSHEIRSKVLKGKEIVDFNIKDLEFKKVKRQRVLGNLNIKLKDESWDMLHICNNIPIRWKSE